MILTEIEPGMYKVRAILFKFIPIKIKSLRIFFEKTGGSIYMKQISKGETSSSYIGKKREQFHPGTQWEKRQGGLEILNMEQGAEMTTVSIRFDNDLVYVKMKDRLGSISQELTFEPLSDDLALSNLTGRGIGDFLKILDNGHLYYSGFEMALKKTEWGWNWGTGVLAQSIYHLK